MRTDGVEAFDFPASCTAASFGGFRRPVDNPPDVNDVKAGRTVPLKFTLTGVGGAHGDTDDDSDSDSDSDSDDGSDDDGRLGLPIDSQPVDCDTLIALGEAPEPIALGGDDGFEREGDRFHVNWKTKRSWSGTCRRLTIRIPAPEDAIAYFQFR